jgi:predicted ATP-grasp superfamily ATP-dependent carboligase
MVVKWRWGTGGTGVRIVGDAAAAAAAVRDLADEPCEVMFQEHLDGDLLGYGAVVRDGVPVQEVAAVEVKAVGDPFGPTAWARPTADAEVLGAGRAVVAAFGDGLCGVEFLRGRDGGLRCIDVSTRVWGSFLGWTALGLDFTEGYLHTLGLAGAPAVRAPHGSDWVAVFPTAVVERPAPTDGRSAARARLRCLRATRRATGARYCAVALAAAARERIAHGRGA